MGSMLTTRVFLPANQDSKTGLPSKNHTDRFYQKLEKSVDFQFKTQNPNFMDRN
jgi:hypothetical protein